MILDKATPLAAVARAITKLGALFHDAGKGSVAFQRKLQDAMKGGVSGFEFMRHEALSYWLLARLAVNEKELCLLCELDINELDVLVEAESSKMLRSLFTNQLSKDLTTLNSIIKPASKRRPAQEIGLLELSLILIRYLSLSHHRLPGKGHNAEQASYTYGESLLNAGTYFNESKSDEWELCLKFQANIYQQESIKTLIHQAYAELRHVMEEAAEVNKAELIHAVIYLARTSLIAGDHLGSALKSQQATSSTDVLANLKAGDLPTPGDTLAHHLVKVASMAEHQYRIRLAAMTGKVSGYPGLSEQAMCNVTSMRSYEGPFAWQTHAHDFLKAHHGQRPSIAIVTAGTGSGKTVLAAQLMAAMGSSRYTYALGLRSLTIQTGNSYAKDLGFSKKDMAVVLGERLAVKVNQAHLGSESESSEDLITTGGGGLSAPWLNSLVSEYSLEEVASAVGAHNVNFVTAPVAVCTVDQLMGVTQLRALRNTTRGLRVATADLILDELDGYSPDEIKKLIRLAFHTGLARRNLVCLSATMGHIHSQAFIEAFRAGVQLSHSLTESGADIYICTISNTVPAAGMVITPDTPYIDIEPHITTFNEQSIAAQALTPSKAVAKLLDVSAKDFSALLTGVTQLHKSHSFEHRGANVSVGAIRMNTVESARSLAKHLLECDTGDDTELSVLCYHSKYSAIELSMIDRLLNKLASRKKLQAGAQLSDAALSDIVTPIIQASPGKQDYIFIVVTTSIIETGRDHDYDWMILEPNSHRSLIQAGGRIRRHRTPSVERCANLGLIKYPTRVTTLEGELLTVNPINVFSYPGPLTPLRESHRTHGWQAIVDMATRCFSKPPAVALESIDSTGLGFIDEGTCSIRNTAAIRKPSDLTNRLALVEQMVLYQACIKNDGYSSSLEPIWRVSALDQIAQRMQITDWAYLGGFRSATKGNDYYVAKKSGASISLAKNPVNEAGLDAGCEVCAVNLKKECRTMLYAVGGDATKALSMEFDNLATALTNDELLVLSRYQTRNESKASINYSNYLGFNR